MVNLGESVKKWEPSDPAGGRERGWRGHPGDSSGGVNETVRERSRIQRSRPREM